MLHSPYNCSNRTASQVLCVLALQAQVCAAGALLNVLGPELERSKLGVVQRQGFGKVMSSLLTLSIVHEALFENMLLAEVA